MQLRGLRFDGAARYILTNEALRPVAGTRYWFSEFQPVNFTGLPFITALLKAFFDANICCHVGGDFPTYIAGVQTSLEGVDIFFALKDNPLLKLIFKVGENPPAIFHVGPFEFALLQNVSTGDVCQYHIRLGVDTLIVTCFGIESASCGVYCNVDFVHFVWENSDVVFVGMPRSSSPPPVIPIAGCCAYGITGLQVRGGHSP
jgi:hypothetical protein